MMEDRTSNILFAFMAIMAILIVVFKNDMSAVVIILAVVIYNIRIVKQTDNYIIEVLPMEVELFLEPLFTSRISKVEGFLWSHSHIYLNHREYATLEDTFMDIPLDLIASLADINFTTLQLNMYDRHTIDKEHHITSTVSSHSVCSLELWLTGNLIATLS